MSPRAVIYTWRTDKFLTIPGVQTLDCPARILVTVLTMLCYLDDVPK